MCASRLQDVGAPSPLARTTASAALPTYARFIGRVGALAVALGIGAAVATNYGVPLAHADDTEQAPAEQPDNGQTGDQPNEGQGGQGQSGKDAHEQPTVTVNGVVVDNDKDGPAESGGDTKVPAMNFQAQGAHHDRKNDALKDETPKAESGATTVQDAIDTTTTPDRPRSAQQPGSGRAKPSGRTDTSG